MKYFIGINIPQKYKNKIELIRAKYNLFTTEPHVTLVPPHYLPDDDLFIKEIIEICKKTKQINIKLDKMRTYKDSILYINLRSTELINLHDQIHEKLNLLKDKRIFVPHLTIVKQRVKNPFSINLIKKRAEKILIPAPIFNVNSIIIYQQPKEKSVYIPYMKIPLGK